MAVIYGTVLYKLSTLFVGFGLAYLGFRLLLAGVFEGGGDLDATFADNKLVLKKASPGIFFALFGTAVLIVSLWVGLNLEQNTSASQVKPIIATGEDEIALNALKEILSKNQTVDSLSDFEISAINELFLKLEIQKILASENESTTSSRGVASE